MVCSDAVAPRVAVVLPVHASGPALSRCLDALATAPPDELVVAVDGGAPDVVAEVTPHADRLVVLARRSGPAAARNRAAAVATADVLLFIDADVVVHDDTVERVRAAFARDPLLQALVGSYDDQPPATNVLSRYKNLLNHHHHQRVRPDAGTFWGACGAMRRTAFVELGGFDELTYHHPSIEDVELGYRLAERGGRIRVDRDLQVTHLKRWTAVNLLHTDVARRALPWAELLLSRRAWPDDLNVDVEHRMKGVLAGLAVVGATGALVAGSSVVTRVATAVALGSLATLGLLDRDLISLWHRDGGLRVAVPATAWHWSSYLYGGAALALAAGRTVIGRSRAPHVERGPWSLGVAA